MSMRGPKPYLVSPAIVALLLSGCGGSNGTAGSTGSAHAERAPVPGERAPVPGRVGKEPPSSIASTPSGSLAVTLTAAPMRAKAGSPVRFELTAYAPRASGALGYQLRFGDGTSTHNVTPQFCVAGRGVPTRQTWHLSHRYKAAGRYRVSASVSVNCSSDFGTAGVVVDVT
jgi:hypothetical protein